MVGWQQPQAYRQWQRAILTTPQPNQKCKPYKPTCGCGNTPAIYFVKKVYYANFMATKFCATKPLPCHWYYFSSGVFYKRHTYQQHRALQQIACTKTLQLNKPLAHPLQGVIYFAQHTPQHTLQHTPQHTPIIYVGLGYKPLTPAKFYISQLLLQGHALHVLYHAYPHLTKYISYINIQSCKIYFLHKYTILQNIFHT